MGHHPRDRPGGVVTRDDGRVVVARCRVAATPLTRLIGLLGTTTLDSGDGVWLTPCRGVHTLAMRMPIACALLDGDGVVLAVRDPLPPWRTFGAAGARSALECAPGALADVGVGDVLRLGPARAPRRPQRPGG